MIARLTFCVDGRLMRHDPQADDPELMTDRGECPDCGGIGCERVAEAERDHKAGITCATEGHLWSPTGKCVFCGHPAPPRDGGIELKAAKLATGMAGVMLGDACSEIDQLRGELYLCHRALEQAQDCILGATPEGCTPEDARQDTIQKIRGALGL